MVSRRRAFPYQIDSLCLLAHLGSANHPLISAIPRTMGHCSCFCKCVLLSSTGLYCQLLLHTYATGPRQLFHLVALSAAFSCAVIILLGERNCSRKPQTQVLPRGLI